MLSSREPMMLNWPSEVFSVASCCGELEEQHLRDRSLGVDCHRQQLDADGRIGARIGVDEAELELGAAGVLAGTVEDRDPGVVLVHLLQALQNPDDHRRRRHSRAQHARQHRDDCLVHARIHVAYLLFLQAHRLHGPAHALQHLDIFAVPGHQVGLLRGGLVRGELCQQQAVGHRGALRRRHLVAELGHLRAHGDRLLLFAEGDRGCLHAFQLRCRLGQGQ